MASVNKVVVDAEALHRLYVLELRSIPEICVALGITRSTARSRLKAAGILRTRADAVRLAGAQGKLGSGMRGKTRNMDPAWRARISATKRAIADATAAGVSHKAGGYTVLTRGPNKDRGLHVVLMEREIGRRLLRNEVVHHKDGNKQNNQIDNLELMTRSEHTRHHRNQQTKGANKWQA